jgi:DNA-binding NarL/FixJ family response regulator
MNDEARRRPWIEGPETGASPDSWLALDDDEILHRIAKLQPSADADQQLLQIVRSTRHFFVRQEAAKHIRNRDLLFPYEDDRHIGQILVRHLNRKDDLAYLRQLAAHSRYSEVRKAAQVQLGRLAQRFEAQAPQGVAPAEGASVPWRVAVLHGDAGLRRATASALPPPEFEVRSFEADQDTFSPLEAFDPHLVMADVAHFVSGSRFQATVRQWTHYVPMVVVAPEGASEALLDVLGRGADEFLALPVDQALLAAKVRALLYFAHRGVGPSETADGTRAAPKPAPEPAAAPVMPAPPAILAAPTAGVPSPTSPAEPEGADPTLLTWAIHFVVEHAWEHLGTTVCSTLLRRTQELLTDRHPVLRRFEVGSNAHVSVDLSSGFRLRKDSVAAVASWMAAFLDTAGRVDPNAAAIDVRRSTAVMAEALTRTGFYKAFDVALEAAERSL